MEKGSLEERLRDPQSRRQAFAELLDQFSEPLYWQIRRMVGSHDDANDLLQNTFMKAWMAMDDFRGDAKLTTWLHKIALNEALSHLEKQKHRAAQSLDDEGARQVVADEYFDGQQAHTLFRNAIDTLPAKQRMVFNMKYFDDMKYEQIAEITGTTVGALKATYHFAVKKIEQFLKNR